MKTSRNFNQYRVRIHCGVHSFNILTRATCEVNAMAAGYRAARNYFPTAKRCDLNVVASLAE